MLFFLAQLIFKLAGLIQEDDVPKPKDLLQDWTLTINEYTLGREGLTKAWQITASMILDIQFFLTLSIWIWKGFSFQVVIALIIFYASRAVVQNLFILPFPDHFYWQSPGFPCLMNAYGRQSDFFFSGHVGFMLL